MKSFKTRSFNIPLHLMQMPSAHTFRVSKYFTSLPVLIIAAILFVGVSGSTAALSLNTSLRASLVAKIASIAGNQPVQEKTATTPAPTTSSAEQPDPDAKAQSGANTTPVIKYSISSDPRSTAYSLTPYVDPATFEHQVTHAGQFAAGTLIAYNAGKGDRTYYGGDLLLSPYTVSIHIVNGYASPSDPIVVTAPDGAAISIPHRPWYSTGGPVDISYGSGLDFASFATSWQVKVIPVNSNPSPGIYVLQITTRRDQGSNIWEYDGFITVNVVDDTPLQPINPYTMPTP